ncbi:MAG: hypothetical protein GY756_13865 [bacterium]|nr:hypothetical protein [bacterium]
MNRHNKRTDILYILYYDDIALSIYYATELNRYLVSYLSVVNNRYIGKFGISVGSSVNFYFENGIVEKIYLHMSF